MKTIDLGYRPRAVQSVIHKSIHENRFTVCVAHRRMGKTVAAVNQLIHSSLQNKLNNPRYAYIAPTYAQAKRVAFDYLCDYTRPIEAEINIAELRVDYLGRRISLYGSENCDSLRGQYFDGVVLDEVGDQNPKIWNEIIRPALADRKGWCLFIGTPRGQNHFMDLRNRAMGAEGWNLLEFKASETNILDTDELRSAEKEMGKDKYEQEFECSFSAPAEGAYYGSLIAQAESESRITKIPFDGLLRTVAAWDLGMADSTAIWIAQLYGKEIRLVDFVENHSVGLDWYVSWLRDKNLLGVEQILPHDVEVRELGTGKSRKEVLQESGLNITVAPKLTIADGIQAVRNILPRCWFDEGVKEGLTALRSYRRQFDEKRSVFNDNPLHDWTSHASDAFRYLAVGLYEQSQGWGKPLNVNTKWIV